MLWRPYWHRPTQRAVAPQFSAGIVGDEQNIGAGRIRRCGSELVLKDAMHAAGTQLPGDEADRIGAVAGFYIELKIDHPDLPVWERV